MTTQPTLFDASPAETLITILKTEVPARARRSDPQTSHDAAASWDAKKLTWAQMHVLGFFLAKGQGTDGDLEAWVEKEFPNAHFGPSSLRKRRKDLCEKGILLDSGEVDGERHMKIWKLLEAK